MYFSFIVSSTVKKTRKSSCVTARGVPHTPRLIMVCLWVHIQVQILVNIWVVGGGGYPLSSHMTGGGGTPSPVPCPVREGGCG